MRRISSLLLLLAASAAAMLVVPPPAAASVTVVVVDGEGFGHGVGMAQDGALAMGREGADVGRILGHFYPGVSMGRAGGVVRVVVEVAAGRQTIVTFPGGGEVRSPREGRQHAGFPVRVGPGASVRIRHDGTYAVAPVGPVRAQAVGGTQLLPPTEPTPTSSTSSTTTTSTLLPAPGAPSPGSSTTTTAPPAPGPDAAPAEVRSSDSVWAVPAGGQLLALPSTGARYRGVIEATAASGPLRLRNELDVEQYLRGMGEVRDPSWPAASLQAQAIAARTYALRAMAAAGEICATQRCQVYLGQQAEYAAMDRAVRATAGQVLRYGRGFAAAVYSAHGGGVSATPREGFGTSDAAYPYLRAAPYRSPRPDRWEERVALADLARRLGYPGTVSGVRVAEVGPSGRATVVALVGSAGERQVPAIQVSRALGLRSTKWRLRTETAATAPPPPPEARIQELPEDVALTTAASSTTSTSAPLRRRQADDVALAAAGADGGPAPDWAVPALLAAIAVAGVSGARVLRRGGRTRPAAEP